MKNELGGLISGLIATVPMTAAMVCLHRLLPRREQYPLPPRQITMVVAEKVGVEPSSMDSSERNAATLISHFAYGAAAGGFYGAVAHPQVTKTPIPPAVAGLGFGLAVWAGSYLGWLPALRILPSATDQPPRRVGLMVVAHAIWGSVLGILTDRLCKGPRPRQGTAEVRSSRGSRPGHPLG